jgi:hypothetical protein
VHRLDLFHGLAARDDDCVEFIEQLVRQDLVLLVLVLLFELSAYQAGSPLTGATWRLSLRR